MIMVNFSIKLEYIKLKFLIILRLHNDRLQQLFHQCPSVLFRNSKKIRKQFCYNEVIVCKYTSYMGPKEMSEDIPTETSA